MNRSAKTLGSAGWDVLFAISIVGLLAAAYVVFFVPLPRKPARIDHGAAARSIADAAHAIEQRAARTRSTMAARTWAVSADELSSEVLALVNRLATANRLNVAGFRAGRVLSTADLWQVTFVTVLEGSFPDVLAVLAQLEDPTSKLAVSQLKISAKNQGELVSASIDLAGFLPKELK